jgi:nitrate/nitrite transport system ATP-binding protein
MLTNGPAATIGDIVRVELPRPRDRVTLAEDPVYVHARKSVIDFLYTRQRHVERSVDA